MKLKIVLTCAKTVFFFLFSMNNDKGVRIHVLVPLII